jgi:hypothetical protein
VPSREGFLSEHASWLLLLLFFCYIKVFLLSPPKNKIFLARRSSLTLALTRHHARLFPRAHETQPGHPEITSARVYKSTHRNPEYPGVSVLSTFTTVAITSLAPSTIPTPASVPSFDILAMCLFLVDVFKPCHSLITL